MKLLGLLQRVNVFDYVKACLLFTGTNPYRQDALSNLLTVSAMSIVCYYISFAIYCLYHDHSFENISGMAESAPVMYQIFMKVSRMKSKRRELKKLLDNFELFWDSDKFPWMEEYLKERQAEFHKQCRWYLYMVIGMVIMYCVKPLTMPERCWPIPSEYHMCDISRNSCYIPIYFTQLYVASLTFMSLSCFDGLFAVVCFKISEQLHIINKVFRHLEPSTDDRDLEQFYELVNHHNFMLACIKSTDGIFNMLLFEQLWSSNLSICMGIFLLIVDGMPLDFSRVLKYTSYLSTFLLEAYIFCYFGQMISDESDEIAIAVFESRWTDSNKKQWKKGVVMVTQMAHNSPKLSVAKMLNLNMGTFTMVLKNSLSFCALIQSVYDF